MPDTILFALRMSHFFFGVVMTMTALFLILLVLVQRGRGGGLSGALGGMGGQSAFGTKAGDTFTKITIAGSIFWILLCVIAVKSLSPLQAEEDEEGEQNTVQQPFDGLVPPPAPDDASTSGDDQTGDDQTGDDAGVGSTEATTEPDGTAEPDSTAAPVDPPVDAESNPDDATNGSDNNDSTDGQ